MRLSLVVPVHNEEEAIPLFYTRVRSVLQFAEGEVEIVFVDDGSTDSTAGLIEALAIADPLVTALSLTRNFGKESALLAGIENATGDAVVPIDVDLQDPVEIVPSMVEKWQTGADMVLAKRIDRSSDTRMKRRAAGMFYKVHNLISRPKIEENVGDFRLMSREVVDRILLMGERNLFMKGLLSWVGGHIEIVEYVRPKRSVGASKFDGWRLWNLALEGVTSFSTVPLRIWTYLGFGVATAALIVALYMLIEKIVWGNPIPGYPSLIVSILFLGGVQLIGIGVLGEYVGRIYLETKRRPRYLIARRNGKIARFQDAKRTEL
ncbi:glycosyltransferase family 2 protein [Aureimonas altamirensis]|uniref:glycosyltransferase family 2 protein n=1 Tax=Aureimonas altamirensis TaxID=370622 RepID=UPI0020368993|nr:glycosyltransferase family 2 protein [Aureimonas altamirensis]